MSRVVYPGSEPSHGYIDRKPRKDARLTSYVADTVNVSVIEVINADGTTTVVKPENFWYPIMGTFSISGGVVDASGYDAGNIIINGPVDLPSPSTLITVNSGRIYSDSLIRVCVQHVDGGSYYDSTCDIPIVRVTSLVDGSFQFYFQGVDEMNSGANRSYLNTHTFTLAFAVI